MKKKLFLNLYTFITNLSLFIKICSFSNKKSALGNNHLIGNNQKL